MAEKITSRGDDYSQWYLDIVQRAELAENSDVRGCMVIRPHGFAIWEKMQRALDRMFKDTGHVNAYFPLFIPKSFLAREEEMAEGFAKECAVVTHYRLKSVPGKGIVVDPEAKLEEELIIRPTSEEEARQMLEVYRSFAEDWMAMPVLTGPKSEGQKFPGAIYTLCIEAMMQDRRALQSGTSHFLGQNFAKAFDVKFQNQEGKVEYAWATSWGVSTRLVGGLIMTHSDDQGLVLPPRLAPIHVVIVPIFRKAEEKTAVLAAADELAKGIRDLPLREWLNYEPVSVKIDDREQHQPGFKFNEWELKGVPVRVELGPKDLEKKACVLARRDLPGKEAKEMGVPLSGAPQRIGEMLKQMQTDLRDRALKFREANTHEVNSYDDFKKKIEEPGGFFLAHWDRTRETEDKIAAETKATIRCIPFGREAEAGKCMVTGKPSESRVVFAKAY
jgi:prolyl-tRNA synthetase